MHCIEKFVLCAASRSIQQLARLGFKITNLIKSAAITDKRVAATCKDVN